MGSLTSRPEIPQAQQPVIVTMPAPRTYTSAPPEPATKTAAPDKTAAATAAPAGAGTSNEKAMRLAREDNLLRRGRGRLGTVLTGLGGLLSPASAPVRKTLLGE